MLTPSTYRRAGLVVALLAALSLLAAGPAHATGGRHVEQVYSMYKGDYPAAAPLDLVGSWYDKADPTEGCGTGDYTITVHTDVTHVDASKAHVQKIVVNYHSYSANLIGEALYIYSNKNYFSSSDATYGTIFPGKSSTRTWIVNKDVYYDNGAFVVEKDLSTVIPDPHLNNCVAIYDTMLHYHA